MSVRVHLVCGIESLEFSWRGPNNHLRRSEGCASVLRRGLSAMAWKKKDIAMPAPKSRLHPVCPAGSRTGFHCNSASGNAAGTRSLTPRHCRGLFTAPKPDQQVVKDWKDEVARARGNKPTTDSVDFEDLAATVDSHAPTARVRSFLVGHIGQGQTIASGRWPIYHELMRCNTEIRAW